MLHCLLVEIHIYSCFICREQINLPITLMVKSFLFEAGGETVSPILCLYRKIFTRYVFDRPKEDKESG